MGRPGKSNCAIHLITHKPGTWRKRKGPGKPGDTVYRGTVNRGLTVLRYFVTVSMCDVDLVSIF